MIAREAAVEDRGGRRIALAVSLLLNLVFVLALRMESMPRMREGIRPHSTITWLRLIEEPAPASRSTEVAVLPPIKPAAATRHEPNRARERSANAPALHDVPAPQAPPLALFGPDGHVILPQDAPKTDAFPTQPMGAPVPHRDALPYSATAFERGWTPKDETLGGELLRRTTVSHRWRTPWGTEVACATWLLVIGGCGWGYAPQATSEELRRMRADPPMPRDASPKALLAK